jgi:putative ABC transport system substrate-binding protein
LPLRWKGGSIGDIYSRRSFVCRLGLFGCVLPLTAFAQQRGRPPGARRVGFLSGAVPALIAAFEEELRKLGYVDGKNIVIEKRISRPNTSDTAVHAAELARMNLDLIVAAALPQALEVRKNDPAMPMVYRQSVSVLF